VVVQVGAALRVQQVLDPLLVGAGGVGLQLLARGAEAGAAQQVRHQRQAVLSHLHLRACCGAPAVDGSASPQAGMIRSSIARAPARRESPEAAAAARRRVSAPAAEVALASRRRLPGLLDALVAATVAVVL